LGITHLSNEGSVGPEGHQPWKGSDGLGFVANYRWDTDTLAWVKLSGTSTGIAADVAVTNFPSVQNIRIQDGDSSVLADVLDLTNSNPVAVAIVDASGTQIVSFGGGTQYAEGTTAATITGTAMLMEGAGNTLVVAQGTAADGLLVNLGSNNDVVASGVAAHGAAVSGNPVLVAGEDPSGNVARLQTSSDGDLITHHHDAQIALVDSVTNTQYIDVNSTDFGFKAQANFPWNFNGTTWDRVRGDATNGLLVNLGSNNDVTVTGSVTANAGTNLNTSALALSATQTDGTQKAIVRGGAKGATTAADVTSTAQSADRQSLDVQIRTSAGVAVDSFGGGSQYTEGDTDASITGTAIMFESNTGTNTLSVVNNTTPLPISDAGGSLTVDGTVAISGSVAVTNAALSVVGGGVEATALRVTIASDSTGVLSIDDNGGSITVDGTVAVSGSVAVTNAALSVVGGGVEATALRVTIASDSTGVLSIDDNGGSLTVDGTVAVSSITTSITPGNAAANLGKAEDAAHASGDTGVMFLGVRNDSGATTFGANGDYCPISTSANGSLFIASIIPGTTSTELGKAEDAAHATGHVGVMDLSVRNDNLATSFSGTDGDYTPKAVDAKGASYAAVYRSTTTLTAINTTYNNVTTTATSAAVDCVNASMACLAFSLTESGTATDIQFEIQTSDDDTTYFPYRRMPFGTYKFDDATIAAYGTLTEQIEFPVVQRYVKVKVTAVGTDATNTFTIASARLSIRNSG
jgi:hypothetical protein